MDSSMGGEGGADEGERSQRSKRLLVEVSLYSHRETEASFPVVIHQRGSHLSVPERHF